MQSFIWPTSFRDILYRQKDPFSHFLITTLKTFPEENLKSRLFYEKFFYWADKFDKIEAR